MSLRPAANTILFRAVAGRALSPTHRHLSSAHRGPATAATARRRLFWFFPVWRRWWKVVASVAAVSVCWRRCRGAKVAEPDFRERRTGPQTPTGDSATAPHTTTTGRHSWQRGSGDVARSRRPEQPGYRNEQARWRRDHTGKPSHQKRARDRDAEARCSNGLKDESWTNPYDLLAKPVSAASIGDRAGALPRSQIPHRTREQGSF
jgi:hypothetical protein